MVRIIYFERGVQIDFNSHFANSKFDNILYRIADKVIVFTTRAKTKLNVSRMKFLSILITTTN